MPPSYGEHKDERNAYYCETCGGYIVTVNLDDGVTPMFLACRVQGEPGPSNTCHGQMHSMMYPPQPWPQRDNFGREVPTEPSWEWYRPSATELKRYKRRRDQATLEHVRKGGLLLRERRV